ncbi:MAG: fibronectin type III domain-containing protein [bacterium]
MHKPLIPALAAVLSALLLSCAGGNTGSVEPLQAAPTGSTTGAGLPSILELAAGERAGSIAGPGWHRIDPYVNGGLAAQSNAGGTADFVQLDGNTGLSYAVYPLKGFGTDSFPTSLRLGLGDIVDSPYFVCASDFSSGRWTMIGPFSGAATVEFPGLTEEGMQRRYVSPSGSSFIGLLATEGMIDFASIEVGVHGGSSGPRPPSYLSTEGNATMISLTWTGSPDQADPDFAGYLLERAPQLFGDYAQIGNGLLQGNTYIDAEITPLSAYRYRVAAVDTSGNRSSWLLYNGVSSDLTKLNPLIVLHAPNGPLYGPVSVEFDFGTDSYDPEDGVITGYFISSPEFGVISAADGKANVQLYPGCHMLQFTIQTLDGRTGGLFHTLRILPQWEAEPLPVLPTPTATSSPRMLYPSALFGLQGKPVLCGYDQSSRSVVLWNQEFDSDNAFLESLPAYWPVSHLSRAQYLSFGIAAAAIMNGQIWLATFSNEGHHWVPGPPTPSIQAADIAGLGFGRDWLLHSFSGSVNEDLVATNLDNLYAHTVIAADVGDILTISTAVDEASQTAHVFVQTTTQLLWYHLDGNMNLLDSKPVGAFLDNQVQACIEPLSGRPLVMSYDTFFRWSLQDELGNWPAMQNIDGSFINRSGGALGAADQAFASFAYSSGQARVYAFNGTGWDVRNTLEHSMDSGWGMALTDAQVDGQMLDLYDTTADGELRALRVRGDGTSEVTSVLPRGTGQGNAMHAINSLSEIHMNWYAQQEDTDKLIYSTDEGASWSMPLNLADSYYKSGTNTQGQIYYSGRNGVLDTLNYWNGTMFVEQWNGLSGGNIYDAILTKRSYDEIYWFRYDKSVPEYRVLMGYRDSGVPPADYAESTFPAALKVWDGVANNLGSAEKLLVMAGGNNRNEAGLAISEGRGNAYDTLVPQLFVTPMNLFDQQIVRGRSMATCSYLGDQLYLQDQAFFATYSADEHALRHEIRYSGAARTTLLDMPYEPFTYDARRTVSADTAPSYTGVMIMSDVAGRDVQLAWSNFGEWEPLPVPEQLQGMGMHELVIGQDNIWRVFYRDPYTDAVWMLSTTRP